MHFIGIPIAAQPLWSVRLIENRNETETIMKLANDNFYTVRVYMDALHGEFNEDINYVCHIQHNS
jgi:hypothetical protein